MASSLSPKGSADKTYHGENIRSEEYTQKRTFGQKAKRHCARFWWLHLIIFCAIFLLVALLVVYVAMPKIAQHQVDDSHLEFREAYFLNPTPETITVTQNAILHNPSTFTPQLDAFPAELYLVTNGVYAATPIMTLPMPAIHAKKATPASIDDKVITITDTDQLAAYAIATISQENITTALVGRTKLHLGKLPTQNVLFNSTSTYKALNGLHGFNTTNLLINATAAPGTPNLKGIASIPNASLMTIEMGNVTLTLSVPVTKGSKELQVVGNSTILDFKLVPGENKLPMFGIIDNSKVAQVLDGGKVNLTIIGVNSTRNGVHLTYYEKALRSNVLTLEMNVLQILADSSAAAEAAKGASNTTTST